MTPNETKFVSEINKRLKANSGKIPAPEYFAVGKLCGMKCKEVVDAKKAHFSGETKPAAVKKPVDVKSKVSKVSVRKEAADAELDALKAKYGTLVEDNSDDGETAEHGVIKDDGNSFEWIASPEEIASTEGMH